MDKEKKKKIKSIIIRAVITAAITVFVIIVVGLILVIYGINTWIKEKDERKYINVFAVIDSVDDGLSDGVRTCTNGDEYLYINGASIFLVDKNGDAEIYTAEQVEDEEDIISAVSFNDKYIFYYVDGMYMINREDKTESRIMSSIVPEGIRAIDDEVFVYQRSGSVKEISSGEVIDILGAGDEDKDKDEYVYDHEAFDFYVFIDGESFKTPAYLIDNSWMDGTNPIAIPARTAVVGNDIYMVVQTSYRHVVYEHQSMEGLSSFDKEALVRYNPIFDETEIIYLIEDNSEQIVNFSVENNKLYTYSGTEIFISDLNGENKTKLCDAPEVEKMYFEYVNDQLLIYDENNNLLGMY